MSNPVALTDGSGVALTDASEVVLTTTGTITTEFAIDTVDFDLTIHDVEFNVVVYYPPPPQIFLSWSNDRGKTFGYPVEQSLGDIGEYLTTVSWNRLGMARDRVFKLQWSAPVPISLNGAFITFKPNRS